MQNRDYSRNGDFDNFNNIDKILIMFNFICRGFSKIKYLLFKYNGINNNEIYLYNNILIIKPKDMITSIFYGTSTSQWCTSAKFDNQFENYFLEDIKTLYILVDLVEGNIKYNLFSDRRHKRNQYKNINNDDVNLEDIYLQYPYLFRSKNKTVGLNTFEFIYDNNISF
jgi:hypothetical protein